MRVKVFSKSGDPYSDMVKNLLKYYNISYDNIDVGTPESFQHLLRESGQTSTPVLIVDGKAYVGFDREMIKEVLGMTKN
jgi:glutaredoxin